MRLIDAHCHLDRDEYGSDREGVIARAKEAGLSRAVLIGLWRKPGDFGDALALRDADPAFFACTAGIHPHEAIDVPAEDWTRLEQLAADPRIVALGEMGLDFHYDHSPRDVQEQAFRRQVRLAKQVGKPVVLHVREAHDLTLSLLKEEGAEPGGVVHCFTGNRDDAARYLELGFFISIAGVVTFKNAESLREAVRAVPLDRLLIETDSPFLAPIPHRGKRNEPAFVAEVARKVAELHGVDVEAVAEQTSRNTERAFRLTA